jgi:hypothetical protein
MYDPLTNASVAQVVNSVLSQFPFSASPDGLVLEDGKSAVPGTVPVMSPRLFTWLLDLRLLRNIPLSYLVPDDKLLPPESIRFFHVDLTWIDRVIDGAFSVANTGTVDIAMSAAMAQIARVALDAELTKLAKVQWTPADGMTGMLIRSELVRRWPGMIVSIDDSPDGVLRHEPISTDVYIALFAGTPASVQIKEPHVGLRFGLQQDDKTLKYFFYKQSQGNSADDSAKNPQDVRSSEFPLDSRVLPLSDPQFGSNSVDLAMNLMQLAYEQQFKLTVAESRGFAPPAEGQIVLSSSGRPLNLQSSSTRIRAQK